MRGFLSNIWSNNCEVHAGTSIFFDCKVIIESSSEYIIYSK